MVKGTTRRGALALAALAAVEIKNAGATGSYCRKEGYSCGGSYTCCSGLTCSYGECTVPEPEPEPCPDTAAIAACVAATAHKYTLDCQLTYSKRKPRKCQKLFPRGSRNRQVCQNRNREIIALHQNCNGDVETAALVACGVVITA